MAHLNSVILLCHRKSHLDDNYFVLIKVSRTFFINSVTCQKVDITVNIVLQSIYLWHCSMCISIWITPVYKSIEPAHEIMALFVLRKFILQTCMRSHPVGIDVRLLVRPFVYFHTSCVQTAKALARLRGCAGSPEPSLVAYAISTIIWWAGSFSLPCFAVSLP